jgi:hypothetical protein
MRVHTKGIMIYILFVGTPLLGLACVLYAGRNLKSPESVGGQWHFEAPEIHVAAAKCDGTPVHPESMNIQQTGSRLKVGLGSAAEPELDGYVKRGVAYLHSLKDGAAVISLQGNVDPGPGHAAMAGTLRFASCQGDIPFQAKREPPKKPAPEKH